MPLTFAYGSNLDCTQMRDRCPSTRFVCIAALKDYRLAFTRHSRGRGCGVADVIPAVGCTVWGVVYEISETDLIALDNNEGYRPDRAAERNAYNRKAGTVLKNGNLDQALNVEIYFAVLQNDPPYQPNSAYKNQIVDGAKFWNLPADYITELEKIEVAL